MYVAQIKSDTAWKEDLYQGIIPIPSENEIDQWREVIIPYKDFYLTFKGYIEEPKILFEGRGIQYFGIMMAERKNGPFSFQIEWIKCVKGLRKEKRYNLYNHNKVNFKPL